MRILLCLQMVIFSLAYPVGAAELIAPAITGLIDANQTGPYQLIMKEAAKRANVILTEKYYPQKRAIHTFLKNKHTYIYSYTDIATKKLGKARVIASFPLGLFKMYIFTKKGEPAIKSLDELKGRAVGGVLGYEDWYENITKAGIQLQMTKNDEQNIKKLEKGRIQAMISFLPDLNKYSEQLSFSPDHPLMTSYDRITAHNNRNNKEFIEKISEKLKEMKEDGTIKKLLGDFYVEWDYNDFFEWKKTNY